MSSSQIKKIFIYGVPMVLLSIIIVGFVVFLRTPKSAEAGWYETGGTWAYRKQITIDHTKVGIGTTTPLLNFPMLFSVTDADLKFTGSGGKVASSTGLDMLFTSSDGTTKLDYEMEYYASTTGQVIAWVRIPSLSPSVDTTIYVYFGNASASDQSNKTGVWDSNYKGVWHLPDGTTLTALDSTSNARNGTLVNTPTATTGQIDGAASGATASHQYISFSSTGLPSGAGARTMSGWVKETSFAGTSVLVFYGTSGSTHSMSEIRFSGTNIYLEGWSDDMNYSGSMSTGTWYYIVGTFDGTSGRIYRNGSLVAGPTALAWNTVLNTGYIGHNTFDSNGDMNGARDEVRISNVARSADWIATEYNNQSSPSTFYSYVTNLEKHPAPPGSIGIVSNGSTGPGWYATGGTWTNRKQITIDHTKVGIGTTTPLLNFPMLFSVTDADLKFTGSGGKVASSTGLDMLFTSSDGTTKLDYEMEYYASTTGQVIAWVRIPSLSPSVDTTIYVYFGNASASDQSNKTGVWDSNYKGVWHLPNGTTLGVLDSTSNANNGTVSGATATSGKIDGATSLTSAQYVDVVDSASLDLSTFTLEAWVFPTTLTTDNGILTKTNASGNAGNFYFGSYSQNLYLGFYDGGSFSFHELQTSNNPINTNGWYHIVGVFDNAGDKFYIYVNGVLNISATDTGNPLVNNGSVRFGKNLYLTYFVGKIDEARISGNARNADWIKTEYNNQSSPNSFYAYGGLQANTRQVSGGGSSPAVKIRVGGTAGTSTPVFVAKYETVWNTAGNKTVMSAVPVNTGDLLVAVIAMENTSGNAEITEDGSSSWVQQYYNQGSAPISIWTYSVTSNENLTVTVTNPTCVGCVMIGATVFRFRNTGGVGVKNTANSTTGLPSVTLAGVSASSAVVTITSDWNAVTGTQTADTSIGAFTPMTGYPGDGGHYGVFGGYYANAGSAGSKTIGMTAPSGQNWIIAGIEIKGLSSGTPGKVKFR